MALTKITGQVINNTTGLVVGVTTVGGGISATDGFFSGIVTAVGNASFSGNVSVGGTLTYEDVTNIDAVGLVTARNGIVVGSGITLSKDGDVFFTGVSTGNGSGLTALNATQLTSGTIPDARFPATLPAVSGANLTGIAATDNVRTGILDVAGISTFRNTVNIGAAVTISESGIEATGVGITVANINGGQISGKRNVLDNGAMQVAQRGNVNVANTGDTRLMDRWKMYVQNSTARFTVTQNSDSPDEFGGSMKIDCTTDDTSLASTDEVYIEQRLEGQDVQHFAKGTSSARQYTLSFYAKTNKTGTYIVNLLSRDNTTGSVSAAYTVSDTNWNRYVVTFPADTNSNRTDDNDNGEALRVLWWFVAGSAVNSGTLNTSWANSTDTGRATGQVNFADSTSNDFYLTGCQLEAGPQVTAYEHRTYGEELERCKRYFQTVGSNLMNIRGSDSIAYSNASLQTTHILPVPMRATPTGSNYDTTDYVTIKYYSASYGSEQDYEAYFTIGIHNGTVRFNFSHNQAHNSGNNLGTTYKWGITQDAAAFSAEL